MFSFLNFQVSKNIYISCTHFVISYCIGVWGDVSQCTSWCNDSNRIHRRIVENLFSMFYFFQSIRCIFNVAGILKNYQVYKLSVASFMCNISKQGKYPMLRSSLCMSYPSHNYITRKKIKCYNHFPELKQSGWISNISLSKVRLKSLNSLTES